MRRASVHFKWILPALFAFMLTACGGGADTELNQNLGSSASSSLITSSSSADVIAFEKNVWRNLSSQSRCGRCHSTGGQSPQFVHGKDIEIAYAAALSFGSTGVQVANLASPNDSLMVTIIRNGHKQVNGKSQACWLATDALCADAIRDFIAAWDAETNGTGAVPQGVTLTAPSPLRDVGSSKNYPTSSSGFASSQVYTLLKTNCAACHSPVSATPTAPFFASSDANEAYLAAQQKMDLVNPANSRFVLRLGQEFHNCWTSSCANDASDMQAAITTFAGTIPNTVIDPNLIVSTAMKLQPPEAIVASGGERHTQNQVALWEFKTGSGTIAYDTSGVEPVMDLSISGDVSWVSGYGLRFNATGANGRAQATFEASQKLLNTIRSRGEYAIEAWVIPANVVQMGKNIISYSGSATSRNFTIAQNEYNYQFYHRATTSNNNGDPVLETAAGDEDLQASLQHIVMNYDPVNGRRIYVNGVYTDDVDANDVGGELTNWGSTNAFILGNELGQSTGWNGTIRMVAVHNRALTTEQIQQNFKAGVGEKYFLLFSISHIAGVPANSYIKMQVEQFDDYSYLFNNPVYVNLSSTVPAINIPIAGMRIGINGKEALVGQTFINLNTNTITANNQEISRLGAVIQSEQGVTLDDFFLTFETLGSENNKYVTPTPTAPAAPADLPAVSDIGVRTFSEVNATMSELTGVPTSHPTILAKYQLLKQQLPSAEDITAFVPANIIGISQLAFEYCDRMIEDTTITTQCERTGTTISARACMFGSFDFTQAASTAYDTAGRTAVADALYDRMVGIPATSGNTLVTAPTRAEIRYELIDAANAVNPPTNPGNLVDRLLTQSCGTDLQCGAGQSGTREIAKAMCTSVLGSAAMLVQ